MSSTFQNEKKKKKELTIESLSSLIRVKIDQDP